MRILLLLLSLTCFLAEGISQSYEIQSLSVKDGLSQGTIYTLYQDSTGFMWIGTQDGGLNKWNGYNFSVYEHLPFCENCISGNDVSSIVEFSKHKFYIGTWGGGVNVFDAESNWFTKLESSNGIQVNNTYVQVMLLDKNKNLWIGTESDGLYRYSPENKHLVQYKHSESNSIINNRVWSLCEDNDGNIWIGTGNGLSYLNVVKNEFVNYPYSATNEFALNDTIVRALHVDFTGNLWLGTGAGFSFLAKGSQKFKHFYFYENEPEINAVNDIIEDEKGNLWIGTFKIGLAYFNTKSEAYKLYQYDPGLTNTINHNDVRKLLIDKSNNLWIATRGGGINIIDLKPEKFPHYKKTIRNKNALSNNRITGVVELNNKLWISTSGGGINVFDLNSNKFTYIKAGVGSISSNTINTIYLDSENYLWIGYWDRGIEKLDSKTGEIVKAFNYNSKLTNLDVWAIFEDSHKNIWVGTKDGLNRIDKDDNVYHYYADENNKNSLSHNYVFCIYEDSEGDILIGTFNGLNIYRKTTDDFVQFKFSSKPDSLVNDRVHTIYEDSQKNLWIGTQLGLHLFHKNEKRFKSFRHGNKIINNTIFSILEDNHNHLWIGLLNGLAQFDINNSEFKEYRFDRNSQFNDFSERVALKLSDNRLFFGGVNGFNLFDPNDIVENEIVPNVVITNISILHQPYQTIIKERKEVGFLQELKLKYNQSTFSISFSALDFTNSRHNQFKYLLEGYDDNWIKNGYNNTASYTKVPPGEYLFKVYGSNNDGKFSKNPATLKIYVSTPFWKTKWFIAFVAFTLILLVYFFIKAREKFLLKAKKDLEQKVIERTAEIEQQKEEIKSQAEELNKLSIVASETDNAVTIMDSQGNFEYVNEGFTKKYGLTLENLINKKGENILLASDDHKIEQYIHEIHKTKQPFIYETQTNDAFGNKIWVQTNLTPIIGQNNEILKIIAIDTDITQLKKVEDELRQTNADIRSSILYAKRIQEALMPSFTNFQKHFPNSFMFYLPKDIVSGDFFWFTKIQGKIVIAVADCTGHGVPGAFMSIIGISFLNEIVKQKQNLDPNVILDYLNNYVIDALYSEKTDFISTDGMDIAILTIDTSDNTMKYAGANHPLYLLRNDQIYTYEGDRMPIGLYQEHFKFSLKEVDLDKNDIIYFSTDGIIDQFGGSSGKKFKSKKFKKLLLDNSKLDMEKQKEEIANSFYNWKGNIEQVDDILVMGMKLA